MYLIIFRAWPRLHLLCQQSSGALKLLRLDGARPPSHSLPLAAILISLSDSEMLWHGFLYVQCAQGRLLTFPRPYVSLQVCFTLTPGTWSDEALLIQTTSFSQAQPLGTGKSTFKWEALKYHIIIILITSGHIQSNYVSWLLIHHKGTWNWNCSRMLRYISPISH